MAVSKGMGARKGREELILSWVIAQPEASRLSKPLMFVCGKQPRPSLQIAHNGDNFIQTKKVSDHRERERERTCVAPGDEKTLLHRFRASWEPEQRNDAAILKPPQCWHTALH